MVIIEINKPIRRIQHRILVSVKGLSSKDVSMMNIYHKPKTSSQQIKEQNYNHQRVMLQVLLRQL